MSDYAVQTTQLTKTYPPRKGWRRVQRGSGTQAVRGIDLAVREGELFGLLGPNGAGKTTLVKMLCTLVLPTSGQAMVGGVSLHNERAIKTQVGLVVTDERSFYWRLSARRNLQFFAAMHGLHGAEAHWRVDEVLDAVGLLDRADDQFSGYSTGMRQRMAIARGLLHRPKILFLDEPTRSLDPISTLNLHNLIEAIRAERGMTVFLITHDLAEAEKLCDRVAVMHKGQLRGVGSAAELRGLVQPFKAYVLKVVGLSAEIKTTLQTQFTDITIEHDQLKFRSETGGIVLQDVLTALYENNVVVREISSAEASLDQVFALLTT